MQKTCYQKLVERVVSDEDNALFCTLFREEYPEFSRRGHSVDEFQDWMFLVTAVYELLNEHPELSLNAAKEYARRHIKLNIPRYRLTEDELQTVYEAEKFGAGHAGVLYEYENACGQKDVRACPLAEIPCREGGRKDVLVVFSGHHESAAMAVLGLYEYVRRHRCLPFGVMFLGLEDNQNMTEFNPKFKLRKSSEYRMYLRQMLALGVPHELLARLLMKPNDTSTAGNIELIADTLRKYDLHDVNLICVTYPVYQMRVASEVPWGLCRLGITDVCVRIAMVPVKPTETENTAVDLRERVFSYDQAEYQLADLSLANGIAHLFREQGKTRFALPGCGEGQYPERFKVLAPLFLAYSYPNVVHELAGTDEMAASVLKIIRTLMLDVYDKGVSGKVQDEQMVAHTETIKQVLLLSSLATAEVLEKGCMMSCAEWLEKLNAFYDGQN